MVACSTPTTVGMPFSKPIIALGEVIPFSSVIRPIAFSTYGTNVSSTEFVIITLSDKSLPSKSLALSATIAWPTTDPLPTPWPLAISSY